MRSNLKKITTTSAIALTATIMTGVTPEPASAQIIEILSIAGSALSSLANANRTNQQLQQQQQYQQYYRPTSTTQTSQQLPNRNWTVGTGNMNDNNFTFCLATCSPTTPQTTTNGVRTGYPVTTQTQSGYSQYPNGVSTQNQQMGSNGYPVTTQTQSGYSQYPNGVSTQNQQMMRTGYPVTGQTGTMTSGYPTQTTTQQTSRPRPTLSIPNIQLQF